MTGALPQFVKTEGCLSNFSALLKTPLHWPATSSMADAAVTAQREFGRMAATHPAPFGRERVSRVS
jgi:hypothetical protein